MGSTVLMLVLMGAAFYFLLIRPQQKRAKQQTEMTNSLAPGARIMLSSGVFGTIRHLGERQAIIEIAPGIEMTVIKQAVVKTLKPEDDEFEYSDDDRAHRHRRAGRRGPRGHARQPVREPTEHQPLRHHRAVRLQRSEAFWQRAPGDRRRHRPDHPEVTLKA
ncbi:MAG: preprotein translocase subunit YajC [Micropruina sp.]|nr:preprotein translocase subunit YajC [Micropruina sp.]